MSVPRIDAASIAAQLRKYYPGRQVPLLPDSVPPEEQIYIKVYPVGFTSIGEYTERIEKVVAKIGTTGLKMGSDGKLAQESVAQLTGVIAKLVAEDLLDLVGKCCQPPLSELPELPHFIIPAIVEAWVAENFLGDRLHPWKRAMQDLLGRVAGGKDSISAMLSPSSLPADTQSPKSSI